MFKLLYIPLLAVILTAIGFGERPPVTRKRVFRVASLASPCEVRAEVVETRDGAKCSILCREGERSNAFTSVYSPADVVELVRDIEASCINSNLPKWEKAKEFSTLPPGAAVDTVIHVEVSSSAGTHSRGVFHQNASREARKELVLCQD